MRFEYNYLLLLEILFPIIFVSTLVFFNRKRKRLGKRFNLKLIDNYIEIDLKRQNFYNSLFLSLALFFAILSLARPQSGDKKVIVNQPLRNIYFALDLSSSMRAEDVSPSRIERAKLDILSVINSLDNEKVGLIFFSNRAFLQCPATTDYDIVINTIQSISDKTTIDTKSNIISPILLAKSLLSRDEAYSSLLVILTDGEDNYDKFNKRLKELRGIKFRIFFTIVGTPFGAPIPKKSSDGTIHYLKNRDDNIIITKINIQRIKDIVKRTGSSYIISKNALYDTKNIQNGFKHLKSKIIRKEFNVKRELYQIPLALSIAFIILYLSITAKKPEKE